MSPYHGCQGHVYGERDQVTARLTFIAHAPTSAQRRAAFPLNEAVDEREIARIAALAWSAPRAQQVVSAPELRAQQTVHALGLSSSIAIELRDCDYAQWSGREMDQLQEEDPEGILAWLTDPASTPHGGESIENLINRIGRWIEQQSDASHTVAVTHPSVIRGAIVHALGLPAQAFWRFDIAPLSLTDLRFNGRVWTVRCAGCPLRIQDQALAWDATPE
jgi:broad specificity phosphatase PhoE